MRSSRATATPASPPAAASSDPAAGGRRLEEALEETVGEPPDHVAVGLADEDPRKAEALRARHRTLDEARGLEQRRQREPEGLAHLVVRRERQLALRSGRRRRRSRASRRRRRGARSCRRGARAARRAASARPTSSSVSRSAAARGSESPGSTRPPGKAMCPDHGSPGWLARSMKSTSGTGPASRRTIATAAWRLPAIGWVTGRCAARRRRISAIDGMRTG